MSEVSWKSASVKNERKLEKTSDDRVGSDEADVTASQHGRSFCAETMSENA